MRCPWSPPLPPRKALVEQLTALKSNNNKLGNFSRIFWGNSYKRSTYFSCSHIYKGCKDKPDLFSTFNAYISRWWWWWWMMNCFRGMANQGKTCSLISNHYHCQRSSPSWISNMTWAGFEPVQNLSLSLAECSCAVVITTTLQYHCRYDVADDGDKLFEPV